MSLDLGGFSKSLKQKGRELEGGMSTHLGRIIWGVGNPEGRVKAKIGCLFLRCDGSIGNVLYVKESGDNTSAGWVVK